MSRWLWYSSAVVAPHFQRQSSVPWNGWETRTRGGATRPGRSTSMTMSSNQCLSGGWVLRCNVTPTRRFFKPLHSRCTPSTRRRSSATSPCSPSSGVQPKPDVHEQDSHVRDSGRSSVTLATQCMRPSCWAD
jgi:hypothetical protein